MARLRAALRAECRCGTLCFVFSSNPVVTMSQSSGTSGNRYAWVDFAKGICIVAVVTLYAQGPLQELYGHAGWLDHWTAFARPFRMPDFFLISGLFLPRVIDRPWRSYLDTKVAHYLYFLALWSLFVVPTTWASVPWEVTPWRAFKNYIYHLYRPEAMLWFILMLAVYFVVTRLIRRVPWWIVLPVGAALKVFPYHTGIYPIDWFGEYFVFFYCGYFFARYFFALADWAQGHRPHALAAVAAWAVVNAYLVAQGWSTNQFLFPVLGMVGICAVVIVSSLLSRYEFMSWLRYLGQNSIVVYLGFFLPLIGMFYLVRRFGSGLSVNLLGVIVPAISILCAMCLFWATRNTWARFLFKRPAWAHLVPPARKAVATAH